MHDLDTIERLNEEACAKALANRSPEDKYLIHCYDGLNLTRTHNAQSGQDADTAKQDWLSGAPGRSVVIKPV